MENNQTTLPSQNGGVIPKVISPNTAIIGAWGTASQLLPLDEASVLFSTDVASYAPCLNSISVVNQFGSSRQVWNRSTGQQLSPFGVQVYATGVGIIGTSKPSYEEPIVTIQGVAFAKTFNYSVKVALANSRRYLGGLQSIDGANMLAYYDPKQGINTTGPIGNLTSNTGTKVNRWGPYGIVNPSDFGQFSSQNPNVAPLLQAGDNGYNGYPFIRFNGANLRLGQNFGSNFLVAFAARYNGTPNNTKQTILSFNGYNSNNQGGIYVNTNGLMTFKHPKGEVTAVRNSKWCVYMYAMINGYWTRINGSPVYNPPTPCDFCGASYNSRCSTEFSQLFTGRVNNQPVTQNLNNNTNGFDITTLNLGCTFYDGSYGPLEAAQVDIGEILIYTLPPPQSWQPTNPSNPLNCGYTQGSASSLSTVAINKIYNYLKFWEE